MNIGPGLNKDNLVFGFDSGYSTLGNGHDGFKRSRGNHGRPTTNTWNKNTYNYTNGNATVTRNVTPPVPPPPEARGYEVYKLQSNDGTLVQNIPWTSQVDQVNGGPYVHSVYCYLESGDTVTVGQHWNPWAYGGSQYPPLGRWVRLSQSVTNSTNNYGNIANAYRTNGVAYFTATQYEPGTVISPFVDSSRSSTECIYDVADRNSTIDAGTVSFNSFDVPSFDGTDDGLQVSTGLNLSSYSAVTYEGIIKGAGVGTYDRWFSGTSGTSIHYPDLALDSGGSLKYIHYSQGTGWIDTGVDISTTTYNHLVFVFQNNGSVKLYVNGSLSYSATNSSGTFPSDSRFMIGNRYDRNGEAIVGEVAVMKIYNKGLSATEVQRNFNSYKTRFGL